MSLFTVPGVAAAQDVSPGCPPGTLGSTEVVGDDFSPATPRELTWTSAPAGAFEDKLVEGSTGDGWRMRATASGSVTANARIDVPDGRQVMLVLNHEHVLTGDARASARLTLPNGWSGGDAQWIGSQGTLSSSFSGTRAARTSRADLSEYAGQSVQLSLRVSALAEGDTWDVHDLAVVTCDAIQPSGPPSVDLTMGHDEVTARWATPQWRPEDVDGYQVRLIDRAGELADRVFTAPADARQLTISAPPRGRQYRVSVSAGGRATTSTAFGAASLPLIGRHRIDDLAYRGSVWMRGEFRCGYSVDSYEPDTPVKLQYRYSSTGSWVNLDSELAHRGRWGWLDLAPTRHTQYRAVLAPDQEHPFGPCTGTTSSVLDVRVGMYIRLRTAQHYYYPNPVRIGGTVYPAHPGMTVKLQRKLSSGAWRTERTQKLDRNSNYRFSFVKKPGGYTVYRVVAPADVHHNETKSWEAAVKVFPPN